MFSLLLALALSPAHALDIAGVTLPDTATVADTPVVLNGAGLREFLWIDIYVGGLYLPTKTTSAKTAISSDVPKRIVMQFIYRKVGRDKMLDTFRDGFAKQPGLGDMTAELAKLEAMFDRDMVAGDVVVLDYVPAKGITIRVNDKAKGTLGDAAFMRGIWSIFLGDSPASEKLKQGMLGG